MTVVMQQGSLRSAADQYTSKVGQDDEMWVCKNQEGSARLRLRLTTRSACKRFQTEDEWSVITHQLITGLATLPPT